jgi:hypothetical protein
MSPEFAVTVFAAYDCLKDAQEISLGQWDANMEALARPGLGKEIKAFEYLGEQIRPPFPNLLVSYRINSQYFQDDPHRPVKSSKRAALIKFGPENEGEAIIFSFFFADDKNLWVIVPGNFKYNAKTREFFALPHYWLFPPALDRQTIMENFLLDAHDEIIALNLCCVICSCKNISLEAHEPSRRLNRKIIARRETPMEKYYTLQVKMPAKRAQREANPQQDFKIMPLHLCRGHFKDFTAERPLLGRHIGRFWWQAQMRGNKEHGMNHKG